jgi:hypothetical protein
MNTYVIEYTGNGYIGEAEVMSVEVQAASEKEAKQLFRAQYQGGSIEDCYLL